MQTWPIVKLWHGLLIAAAASWGVRSSLQRILCADHPLAVDSNLLLSPCDGISWAARPMRKLIALLTAMSLLELAACKPPRAPREIAEGNVTGRWSAESIAAKTPEDVGRTTWGLELEQQAAGKLRGRGTRTQGIGSSTFSLTGVRAENEVQFEFKLRGESVTYHGSLMDAKTIVGEMQLRTDTLPVTFTRN
jgi:hypothetical protein